MLAVLEIWVECSALRIRGFRVLSRRVWDLLFEGLKFR
jgi:hypothetical protein